MPPYSIHLLLSLKDLQDLLPLVVRDFIGAFVLAPEVLGHLAGPVDAGRERLGKLIEVVKSFGYDLRLFYLAALPAKEPRPTQIFNGDVGAIGVCHRGVWGKFVFGLVRLVGERVRSSRQ